MHNVILENVHSILVQHTAFASGLKALDQAYRRVGQSPSLIVSLLGDTGSGKSTLLEAFKEMHPPSRDEDGVNSPIIYFLTPTSPTEKSLAFNIMDALGDPIKSVEWEMTSKAIKLIKGCGVKAICIDEIQHFIPLWGAEDVRKAANWLKNVASITKILLVISGTEEGIRLFAAEPQLSNRATQHILLPRFDWENLKSRAEFCGILKGFKKKMVNCSMPEIHKNEIAHAFWIATLGIPRLLANLLSKTTWNVHDHYIFLERQLSQEESDEEKSNILAKIDEICIESNGKHLLNLTLWDFELAFHETRGLEHVNIQNPFSVLLGPKSRLRDAAEPKFEVISEPKPRMLKKKKLAGLL